VYVFGNGDWGQLGIGNPKNFHEKAEGQGPENRMAEPFPPWWLLAVSHHSCNDFFLPSPEFI